MKIKRFPLEICRGFELEGDKPNGINGTDVTVYKDAIHINQYWAKSDSAYIAIEGKRFEEFMEGIAECLAILGEAPPKELRD